MRDLTRLIVYERQGRWVASLRRFGDEALPPIVETRSLDECWQEATASRANLIVLEANHEHAGQLVGWLERLHKHRPAARVVICSTPPLRNWQWLWREAGAIHVVHCRRELSQIRPLIERHLLEHPAPPRGIRADIWNQLPWADIVPAA